MCKASNPGLLFNVLFFAFFLKNNFKDFKYPDEKDEVSRIDTSQLTERLCLI